MVEPLNSSVLYRDVVHSPGTGGSVLYRDVVHFLWDRALQGCRPFSLGQWGQCPLQGRRPLSLGHGAVSEVVFSYERS